MSKIRKRLFHAVRNSLRHLLDVPSSLEAQDTKMLIAKMLIRQMKDHGLYESVKEAEFKVYSQFGDDGIIQYLLHHTNIEPNVFIEFGVENYREATTRFLLMNNNWRGLVIDSSRHHIESIRKDRVFWFHDLTTENAFVTRDNINELFERHRFSGDIGILHIDIDGNDYWIWDAITSVNPAMVIVEYNSVFGVNHPIVVPYVPHFERKKAHSSNLYYGASLSALCHLAEQKNYQFVGSNSAGNNAYFLKKDNMGTIRPVTAQEGYVRSKFRESFDQAGNPNFLSGKARLQAISDMPVYHLERNATVKIHDIMTD